MPPMAPLVTPPAHPTMKLSKLVKDARQLGCETFSGTINVVTAKNWLKRISDTLIDMELDDELKLSMATRLMDKNAATWRDNLKLRSIAPLTWNYFIEEFNEQYYTHFHKD